MNSGSLAPGGEIIVDFGDVTIPLDATNYHSVAYWVSCPGFISLSLIVTGPAWSIDITLSSEMMSGSVPIPVGMSWGDVTVTLTNITASTVTALNFIVGMSKEMVATGVVPSVAPMTTTLSRDLVYTTSIDDEYPLSLRSSNDAALMVSSMIPRDVATLDGFAPVTTINGFANESWGNIPPTFVNNDRKINLPSVTGNQHVIIAPDSAPIYPTLTTEYIIDVDPIGDCQVKFGSLEFDMSLTSVSLGLLRPQSYNLFTVTSATGVAGILSITINGINISGAVGAATGINAQANNIVTVINSNPTCLARAVAIADRVYVRTLMTTATGTMSVNNLYTVFSTPLLSNAGFSETSVPLSSNLIAARKDSLNLSSYRFWVTPDKVTCYRRSPNDFTSWAFIGSHSLMTSYNGGDGDLLVFNSTSYGTDNPKSVKSVSMYAKNSKRKVIASYELIRTIPSWIVATMVTFMVPKITTGAILRGITIQNTTGNPVTLVIRVGGRIEVSTSTTTNIGSIIVLSGTFAGLVTGGTVIRSFLFAAGVSQFPLDMVVAPNLLYTISVEEDPVASAKTGRVGLVALFDEVI